MFAIVNFAFKGFKYQLLRELKMFLTALSFHLVRIVTIFSWCKLVYTYFLCLTIVKLPTLNKEIIIIIKDALL